MGVGCRERGRERRRERERERKKRRETRVSGTRKIRIGTQWTVCVWIVISKWQHLMLMAFPLTGSRTASGSWMT
tara:strand:- start:2141 stop:2362 length:222 start_codon:yes stop_codon:yes gene_type:complete